MLKKVNAEQLDETLKKVEFERIIVPVDREIDDNSPMVEGDYEEKEEKWRIAMSKETQSFQKNQTWELTNLPEGKKAIRCKWMDVKTTFLHGDLEEEIYMVQPEGFKVDGKEHEVLFEYGSSQWVAGYCGSDYVGDLEKRISTTGYVFTLAKAPISWKFTL
nr:retrotransposon protein, putative, Ty1-copia subclass [Tanacetum cinerariifolium]